jgi:hypothetical protein
VYGKQFERIVADNPEACVPDVTKIQHGCSRRQGHCRFPRRLHRSTLDHIRRLDAVMQVQRKAFSGLYSAVDAMTSMRGAPDRSARLCSTRCGESVSGWATRPVTTHTENNATPANTLTHSTIVMASSKQKISQGRLNI